MHACDDDDQHGNSYDKGYYLWVIYRHGYNHEHKSEGNSMQFIVDHNKLIKKLKQKNVIKAWH